MKEIPLNNRITLKFCDHSDELTIDKFNQANEYSLLDSDVGNTPEAIIRHHQRMDAAINAKDWDQLTTVRKNMHMAYMAQASHYNFIGLQFAMHVKAENETMLWDYSIETLRDRLERWGKNGLTMQVVREAVEDVKKKSSENSASPSPSDSAYPMKSRIARLLRIGS